MKQDYARSSARGIRRYVLLPLIILLALASLLPLVDTNVWWIRYLDFARLQIAIALLIVLALYAAFGAWRRKLGLAAIGLAFVALGYHSLLAVPTSGFWIALPFFVFTSSPLVTPSLSAIRASARSACTQRP